MSYIKTETFGLPSDKDARVRMKLSLSYGDWSACLDFYRGFEMPKPQANEDKEATKLRQQLAELQRNVGMARVGLTRLILDWTLTDADDQPIPLTVEGLETLQREDLDFLHTKASAVLKGRSEETEGPFGKRSGRRSRATKPSSRRRS